MSKVIGISCSCSHSNFKSLKSSESKIAIKGTGIGSQTTSSKEDLLVEFLIVEDKCSHYDVRVSTSVFSQAMVGNISAEEKGGAEEG